MLLTIEKLKKRTRQLEAYRYLDMEPVTPLSAMPGQLGADSICTVPQAAIEGAELNLGDEFNGRDKYLWAGKTLRLPAPRKGCQVAGLFDFGRTGGGNNSGFEALLYLNGKPYQAVDTNHQDVIFDDFAGQEANLTFLLWTGLEGGGAKKTQCHRINEAGIGYLHIATDEFYYLSKAIYKTLELPDTAPEKHTLTAALNSAYLLINWDDDKFYKTIEAALASLQNRLRAWKSARISPSTRWGTPTSTWRGCGGSSTHGKRQSAPSLPSCGSWRSSTTASSCKPSPAL